MVGSKCCDFKNREVSNVNAPIDGMVLGNAKVNDHRVSDKINNFIVCEMKKMIKNVMDGTII